MIPENKHWLIDVALSLMPDTPLSQNFQLSENAINAWQQVTQTFHISEQTLLKAASKYWGLAEAATKQPAASVVTLLPEDVCRKYLVVPIRIDNQKLVIAISDPKSIDEVTPVIRFNTSKSLEFEIMSPESIDTLLTASFARIQEDSQAYNCIDLDELESHADEDGQTTTYLVKKVFRDAIQKRASDIHIQPFARGGIIRFRIDGIMQRIFTFSREQLDSVSRYIKTHGGMDSSKILIAQDGRIRLVLGNKDYDSRISILPNRGGEHIVVRILDQDRIFSLKLSGFSLVDLQAFRRLTSHKSGILLLTGPTGSGKTSTLYSIMSELNQPAVNILTIEDPVEYSLQGVSQTQVNVKQGLSFADSLRAILRQDPDIVLVGEIRDSETAQIAAQAALTGHLVLSTLHTNDAVAAIPRLLNLGLDANVLANTLLGVVAQRLVRKLCSHCKAPTEGKLSVEENLFKQFTRIEPSHRAIGCDKCYFTGYLGRAPLVEIFEVNATASSLIEKENCARDELIQSNLSYKCLALSAVRLIVSGETTVTESVRTVGREFWSSLAREYDKPMPNIVAFDEVEQEQASVIVYSEDENFRVKIAEALGSQNMNSYGVFEIEAANAMLQQYTEIVFLIIDLQDKPDEEIVKFIHEARVAWYWSKLPALLLLPEAHSALEAKLVADGAISKMFSKPVSIESIVEYISSYTLAHI